MMLSVEAVETLYRVWDAAPLSTIQQDREKRVVIHVQREMLGEPEVVKGHSFSEAVERAAQLLGISRQE